METMISEVSEFCRLDNYCAIQAHQQVFIIIPNAWKFFQFNCSSYTKQPKMEEVKFG